jgi:pimeloyl-ACP methyl ester carboxylesterase
MVIVSKDGTKIAYSKVGNGPALILVGGAFCYRQNGNTNELAQLLAGRFTVYDYDRRGRGESGDTPQYSVERELEDLHALLKATGEEPFVCGFSSGCGLVLQAADRGFTFKKIVLYEPPYVALHETDALSVNQVKSRLKGFLGEGKKSAAVSYFLKEVVRVPWFFIFFFRFFNPGGWKKNTEIARTLLYDLDVMGDLRFPVGLASKNGSPVLVVGGDKSPERLKKGVENVAMKVPNSKSLYLKGQTHNVSVKVLAPVLIQFFR